MKFNENGLELARWKATAGYQGRATEEVRAAWEAGEDPSDHRKANEEQRNPRLLSPRLLPEPPAYARALLFSRAHALRCETCQSADAQLAPWLCCGEGLRLLQVARDARVSS